MDVRRVVIRGFSSGVVAGLVLVALMYLAKALIGTTPLPQLLQQPILAVMPGFVFGFLIDTLKHAGKVVEEAGIIVGMIVGLGVLGGAWAWARRVWARPPQALVFAAAGWTIVAFGLLPISGDGFLGLKEGPTAPLVWGVLFAVYGAVLQVGGDPATRAPVVADPGRRRMLRLMPIGIAALSAGGLAYELLPRWYQAVFKVPEAGLSGASAEITPVENFYVVSKNFSDPVVLEQGWTLNVGGLVDNPLHLSLADLRALHSATEYVTLECISNNVGGPLMSTGHFTGVRLHDIVTMAEPRSSATYARFKARDGYTESLPLSLISGAPEILVAYALDGAPLPTSHGYPARILVPGHYGMKGPKWLESIDLASRDDGGYWESEGWDRRALVKTTARFDVPKDGDIAKAGKVSPLRGVAFAGTRGISKVEYSTDGGRNWSAANLRAPLSSLAWVLWEANWTPAQEGAHVLQVRAVDGTGASQERTLTSSYPSGASGYHTIHVDVAG
ncbi:MAG TPA: molybdopterin-dependent oxidoreductase [Candidatus Dormibacteraeota bacterium]|nr:molybdopterin-dependent oxidoreductase [Candidatus Dormibacteraeota bacterium]